MAISRAGSLSGAGRAMSVSHATVFRKLGEIERRLGVTLFERSPTGYMPTPAGEEVAATANRLETDIRVLERQIVGRDLRPSGTVSVTTTDTLLFFVLSPIFAEFSSAYPNINLDVAVSNDLFNLSRREADVAIRPSTSPPESLVGRRLGTIRQAVYGHLELVGGERASWSDTDLPWIGPDDRMGYIVLENWMVDQKLDMHCRQRINSVLGMYAAVKDRAGLAVLPSYMADQDDKLIRVGGLIPALEVDLWLLTHESLRRTARVRVLSEFVAAAIKARLMKMVETAGPA